jgi:hypothetical protein
MADRSEFDNMRWGGSMRWRVALRRGGVLILFHGRVRYYQTAKPWSPDFVALAGA